jgi:hypothetical protein
MRMLPSYDAVSALIPSPSVRGSKKRALARQWYTLTHTLLLRERHPPREEAIVLLALPVTAPEIVCYVRDIRHHS